MDRNYCTDCPTKHFRCYQCSSCGKKFSMVLPDYKFCPECGHKFNPPPPIIVYEKGSHTKKKDEMKKGTRVLVTTAPPGVRKVKGTRCYMGTCIFAPDDKGLVTVFFKNGSHRAYHKSWLTELKG